MAGTQVRQMPPTRRDVWVRDRIIIRLYLRGVARKQIPQQITWLPVMKYDAVKKVVQKYFVERRKRPR